MKFTVEREHLLKPLQQVSGPLGGRPTLPILGNLLLQVADGTLSLTGTDLEMEMVARVALVQPHEPGATTVPARPSLMRIMISRRVTRSERTRRRAFVRFFPTTVSISQCPGSCRSLI